jgi:hypothetical protein
MAYIAREPSFGAFERQTITPDGSTTTFTLNYTVGSSSSVLVSVAGVVQDPTGAYGISNGGTQIVFTAAPASGDTVFIIFLGIGLDSSALLSTSSITSQTDLGGAPATGDSLLIHDTDASALKEMTVANLFTSPAISSPTITSGVIATSLDMNGTELILDADADTSITADTDDQIDFKVGGSDLLRITATALVPASDDAYDLGSSSLQFRDIYTGDLNLNNTKSRNNEVDGTSGSWTIQEGENDLYLLNRLNGKKYKFKLEEIQ